LTELTNIKIFIPKEEWKKFKKFAKTKNKPAWLMVQEIIRDYIKENIDNEKEII